jgi:protein-L-isoaspartate O-methyltransferase
MAGPTPEFWQTRFARKELPWDRGEANPQLQTWLATHALAPGAQVLVPGCGRGWEVAELAAAGMRVTGIDYAAGAIAACAALLAERGLAATLVEADVLQWQPEAPADAIWEQTCLLRFASGPLGRLCKAIASLAAARGRALRDVHADAR